jgi:hypothetical protein
MKQMVLAFFDAKGLIYANYMPRGTMVNAKYIVDARGKFFNPNPCGWGRM